MSDTVTTLRSKIESAGDLQSVVRTMKALAASSIGQYEQSVRSLAGYYRAIELGLSVCLRESAAVDMLGDAAGAGAIAIVFGSDQGLVGQFNDVVADHAIKSLKTESGSLRVWAVGERVHARLSEADLPMAGLLSVPASVQAISLLVAQIQIDMEAHLAQNTNARVLVFHNRPESGAIYKAVTQALLPLDRQWEQSLTQLAWPTKYLPEIMFDGVQTLRVLIREYLFISLFRACAESLASENASRLAAMERADSNIDELLEDFRSAFNQLRQSAIDEELFDVVAGYESASLEVS